MAKTIVVSFDSYQAANLAVRELIDGGFMERDINEIASIIAAEIPLYEQVKVTDTTANTETGPVTGEAGASAPPYTTDEAERERRLYGAHADSLTGLPLTADPEGDNLREATIRR